MTSHPFLDFDYLYVDAPSLSLADRILEPPSFDFILKSLEFLKWSAVGLALVAAFGSLVFKLKKLKPPPSHEEEESYPPEDEDGLLSSSISSSEKAYPLRNHSLELVGGGRRDEDEDFSVAGGLRSGMLRLRVRNPHLNLSSWSPNCEVVKLWGVDLRGGRGDSWSCRGGGRKYGCCWVGESGDYNRGLVMGVWDKRMRPDVAAIAQEWRPLLEEEKLLFTHSLSSQTLIFGGGSTQLKLWLPVGTMK